MDSGLGVVIFVPNDSATWTSCRESGSQVREWEEDGVDMPDTTGESNKGGEMGRVSGWNMGMGKTESK